MKLSDKKGLTLKEMLQEVENQSPEEIFTEIYKCGHWKLIARSRESENNYIPRSGEGSSIISTAPLRNQLTRFVKEFHINTFFDAPCGDFHWMQMVDFPSGMKYIGADIVKLLLESNQFKYPLVDFRYFNIVEDEFPEADVWFCRDCLFHFPYDMIRKTLQNFTRSNIRYAMLTGYLGLGSCDMDTPEGRNRAAMLELGEAAGGLIRNANVKVGGWFPIDLFTEPFNFPQAIAVIPDNAPDQPLRGMFLWDRETLANLPFVRGDP